MSNVICEAQIIRLCHGCFILVHNPPKENYKYFCINSESMGMLQIDNVLFVMKLDNDKFIITFRSIPISLYSLSLIGIISSANFLVLLS